MDKNNNDSGDQPPVKENSQKRRALANEGDEASSSVPSLAKRKFDNINASVSKSGTIGNKNKVLVPRGSHRRISASSESNVGKNVDKTKIKEACCALSELHAFDPIVQLYAENVAIGNGILSLHAIINLGNAQYDLIKAYSTEALNRWKEVEDAVATAKESAQKSQDHALREAASDADQKIEKSRIRLENVYDDFNRFLRNEQQLRDDSLAIASHWCMFGNDYVLRCKTLLCLIYINVAKLMSEVGPKDIAECMRKRHLIYESISCIECFFTRFKDTVQKKDAVFLEDKKSLFQKPIPSHVQGTEEYSAVVQLWIKGYHNATNAYRKTIKEVRDQSLKIKEHIEIVDSLTSKMITIYKNLLDKYREINPE